MSEYYYIESNVKGREEVIVSPTAFVAHSYEDGEELFVYEVLYYNNGFGWTEVTSEVIYFPYDSIVSSKKLGLTKNTMFPPGFYEL